MNCTTCGRENPQHLTFCQECGQRLGPRIAPPTPPIGLGVEGGLPTRDFYAANPHQAGTSLGGALANTPAARPPVASTGAAGPQRPCRICATPNPPGLRYCTSCGSTLDPVVTAAGSVPRLVEPVPTASASAPAYGAPIAPAPAPFAASAAPYDGPPRAAPVAPQPIASGAPAIAPMRVVDLGGNPRPNHDAPRMCSRCRGVVDPAAQFCKFCGASLAEGAPTAQQAPEPLAAHERLSLPRTNGAPPRAPTVPMSASSTFDTPLPVAAPPPLAASPYSPPPAAGPPAYSPPPAYHRPPPADVPPPVAEPAYPARPPVPIAISRPSSTPPPLPSQLAAAAPVPAAERSPTAARAAARGRLVVIAKSGADGPSYPFGDALDVGRVEGQIIVGEDPYLSPRHVRIVWTGSKLVLRDLASTNGVYIRLIGPRDMHAEAAKKAGRPAPPVDVRAPGEVAVPLVDQDLILVGQQVLRFELVRDGEVGLGPATEHGTLLFGSPAAPRYARLSQRTVEGVTRDVYYVRKVETVLGRESGDVVFTEDPFLSRRHAAIRVLGRDGAPVPAGTKPLSTEGVSFALVDLGSSNGSFLRIRNEVELVPGDHFRVGQQLFRVDFDASGLG